MCDFCDSYACVIDLALNLVINSLQFENVYILLKETFMFCLKFSSIEENVFQKHISWLQKSYHYFYFNVVMNYIAMFDFMVR